MRVPLTVTRAGLRFSIIQHLQSPWKEWSRDNSQVTLESLEMHKSPIMILFDPREPLNDPDAMVLQDFFLRSTAKDPVPKFHASTKVAILLIMTHAQYESVQLWREQIDESVSVSLLIQGSSDSDIAKTMFSASIMLIV